MRKTQHIYIENHILLNSAYQTPKLHAHTAMHLLVASEGRVQCQIREEKTEAPAVFIDSDVPHTAEALSGSLTVFLIDTASFLAGQIREKYLKGREAAAVPQEKLPLLAAACHGAKNDLRLLDSRILEALELEEKEGIKADERITDCLTYMKSLPDNLFDELLSRACLSRSRFSHLFKQETGLSFHHYFVILKMRKFYEAYLSGKDITESAMQAGFDSPSHFAAVCKRQFGISFSDFIKST